MSGLTGRSMSNLTLATPFSLARTGTEKFHSPSSTDRKEDYLQPYPVHAQSAESSDDHTEKHIFRSIGFILAAYDSFILSTAAHSPVVGSQLSIPHKQMFKLSLHSHAFSLLSSTQKKLALVY